MRESELIPSYMERFQESVQALWWHKLPDNPHTGKKPFDVVGYYRDAAGRNRPLAFEFKIQTSLDVWRCASVMPHQEDFLLKVATFDVDARIILGVRVLLTLTEQDKLGFPRRRVNFDVEWPVADFVKFRAANKTVNIRDLVRSGEVACMIDPEDYVKKSGVEGILDSAAEEVVLPEEQRVERPGQVEGFLTA